MTDIVAPPTIDPMPPAPQPTDTPAEFDSKGFATVAALGTAVTQMNAANQNVFNNATAAQERATAADASADTATEQADLAMGYRNTASNHATTATTQAGIATGAAGTATTQAGIATTAAGTATTQAGQADTARQQAQAARTGAEAARTGAEAARDQAQIFATQQLVGHSTTSLTPGAGAKTFAIETGRAFVPGMYLAATSVGTPAARMSGYVSSYDTATGALVINVDAFGGTGAHTDWAIGVAVAGQVGGMTTQVITANTTGVVGVTYIIAAAGIKLTLPTAWTKGDAIGVVEAIVPGSVYGIDFGTTPVRGSTWGDVSVPSSRTAVRWTYEDTTRGLI